MTLAINNNDVISSFIPNVYISRIILSDGNKTTKSRGQNPHIDIPTLNEYVTSFDPKKMTAFGVTLDDIKHEYFKTYTGIRGSEGKLGNPPKKKPTEPPLIVRLDFVINDVIDYKMFSNWLTNDDITKFLWLTIIQATDAETIYALHEAKPLDMYDLVTPDNKKMISLNALTQNKKLISSYDFTTDSSGRNVYDITFSMEFEVTHQDVESLAYFAFVHINKATFENSFTPPIALPDDDETYSSLFGKQVFEPVIANKQLITEAVYYTNEDDEVLLGNLPTDPELGAFTDPESLIEDDENSRTTIRNVVTNTKIQDFRARNILSKTVFDFTQADNLYSSKKMTQEEFFKVKNSSGNTFASELFATKNKNSEVIMTFGLDLRSLFLKCSQYGKIWYNLSKQQKYKILTSNFLKNLTLIRKRVKGLHDDRIFDENLPITRIAEKGMTTSIDTGQLYGLTLDFEVEDYQHKHFSAKDSGISTDTTGYYQYGIRFDVEDKIKKLVLDKNFFIELHLNKMKEIYKAAEEPRYYNHTSNTFTPLYKDNFFASYNEAVMPLLATFGELHDILFGKKDAQSASKAIISLINMSSPATGNPQGMQYLVSLIQEFVNNVNMVFSPSAITNSPTGNTNNYNPSGVKSAKTTSAVSIEHYFPNIVDMTNKKLGADFLTLPDVEGGIEEKVGIKNVFYDFFDERVNQETLKYFKDVSYDVTVVKSFGPGAPGDKLETNLTDEKYTFLSPTIVITPENGEFTNFVKGSSPINFEALNNIYLEMCKKDLSNLNSGLVLNNQPLTNLSPNDKKQKSQLNEIIGLKGAVFETSATEGVSLYSLTQPLEQNLSFADSELGAPETMPETAKQENSIISPEMIDEPNYNDALFYLSGIDKAVTYTVNGGENTTISALVSPYSQIKMFFESIKQSSAGGPASPNVGDMKIEDLIGMPNQLKQLNILFNSRYKSKSDLIKVKNTVKLTNFVEDLWTPEKIYGMYTWYFNLVEIEYLGGYLLGDINYPYWIKLTATTFSNIKESKKAVLCRMKNYANEKLGIYQSSNVLPIYDKYFILSNNVGKLKSFVGKNDNVAAVSSMAEQMKTMDDISSKYLNASGGDISLFKQKDSGTGDSKKIMSQPSFYTNPPPDVNPVLNNLPPTKKGL